MGQVWWFSGDTFSEKHGLNYDMSDLIVAPEVTKLTSECRG
jgi:hypothetical protein